MLDQAKNKFQPINELASGTPYSGEYLSLLARQGKLRAKKIDRKWHSTKEAVQEYITKQIAERKARGELLDVYAKQGVPTATSAETKIDDRNIPVATPPEERSSIKTYQQDRKNYQEKNGDELFERFISRFITFLDLSIENHFGFFHRFRKWFRSETKETLKSGKKFLLALIALLLFTLLPVEEVFSSVNDAMFYAYQKIRDAETLMGHRAGTSAGDVLLIDENGDASIRGHIITEGQLRSHIADGVAPIVVDSTTLVENLNADYFDNLSSEEFTLAFVTANGNVTYEDVFLKGDVEVGETLLVEGAAKLLSELEVHGELRALSDVFIDQDLSVAGFARFKDLEAEGYIIGRFLQGKTVTATDEVSAPRVVGTTEVHGGAVRAGNLTVDGQSAFGGTAYFDGLLVAEDGDFSRSLETENFGAFGKKIQIGNQTKTVITAAGTTFTYNGSEVCTLGTGCGEESPWESANNIVTLTNATNSVGIGTSTPAGKFGVTGNVYITGTTTVGTAINVVGSATSTYANGIDLSGGCFAQNGACIEVASGNFLRADANDEFEAGNILTINGTLDADGEVKIADTSIEFDGAQTNISITGDFSFNADDFYLDKSEDSIGIGDITPDAHFEISANGTTGGNIFLLSSDDGDDGDLFTVTENGLIGIGTTSPYAALSVVGQVVGEYFTATSSTATSTFNGGVYANVLQTRLTNCDSLDTDANGIVICGTDATGGGGGTGPGLIVQDVNGTAYNTASTTGRAFLFQDGFVSSGASSTIGDALQLDGLVTFGSSGFTINSETFTDLTGAGLQLNGSSLETTLGTSVDLTSEVTGTLPETNGGTGQSTYTTGDILYSDGANSLTKLGIGTGGQILAVTNGVPGWVATSTFITTTELDTEAELESQLTDVTNVFTNNDGALDDDDLTDDTIQTLSNVDTTGATAGNILYLTSAGNWVDTSTSTFAFQTDLHDAVTLAGSYDYLTLSGQEITLNQIDLTTDVTGILPVVNGGTASSTPSRFLFGDGAGNLTSTSSIASIWLDPLVLTSLELDTYSELNALVSDVTLTHNGLIDTFSELDTIVADKDLVNLNDTQEFSGLISFANVGTTTFANGIDLSGGCFAVSGACITGSGGTVDGSGTQNRLAYFDTASSVTSANFLSVNTGDATLGVGTSTPWSSATLAVEQNGVNPSFIVGDNGTSSPLFIIDPKGNIGIGTSTPEQLFGTVPAGKQFSFSGGDGAARVVIDGTQNGLYFIDNDGTVDARSSGIVQALDSFVVQGFDDTGSQNTNAIFRMAIEDGNFEIGDGSGNFDGQLSIYQQGADDILNLFDGGVQVFTVLDGGNVGIGTTTPGSLLAVEGIANFDTATSTFYGSGGINISGGCFAVNGTCVSGGSGHDAVTLAGSYDYLTLSGQEITLNQIDLTTDVTGILPVVNGGTASSTPSRFLFGDGAGNLTSTSSIASIWLDPLVLTSLELDTEAELESQLTDVTNVFTNNDGALDDDDLTDDTIQTLSNVDTTGATAGNILYLTSAGNWVDTSTSTFAFQTDLHDAVTLAGSYDYLTLSGQEITLNQIDLTTDVTGILPVVNGGTASSTPSRFLFGDGAGNLTSTSSIAQNWIDESIARDSELHDAITLSGTPDYITLSGQEITRNKLDISDDTNATGGTGITISANDFSFDCSEVEGVGVNCAGEAITLDTTGDWTGTLDGVEGAGFLRSNANDEFETGNTLTVTGTLDSNGEVRVADTSIEFDGASTEFSVTGNFSVDVNGANDFFINQSTGAIGFGTSTPTLTGAGDISIGGVAGSNADLYVSGGLGVGNATTTDGGFVVGDDLFVYPNGRIGIGTTTPGSLLAVEGIANFNTATSTFYGSGGINISGGCFAVNGTCVKNEVNIGEAVGSGTSKNVLFIDGSGNLGQDTDFQFDSSTNELEIQNLDAESGGFSFRLNGVERTAFNSNETWDFITSNGTGGKLTIDDNDDSATNDPQITFEVGSTEEFSLGVDDSDSDKFKLSSGGTLHGGTILTVTAAGLVGIGTTTPEEALTINGDLLFTNAADRTISVDSVPSGTGRSLTISSGDGDSSSFSGDINITTPDALGSGNINIFTDTVFGTAGDIAITGGNSVFGSNTPGEITITAGSQTASGNGADVTINAGSGVIDGDVLLNSGGVGNVGIGTTSPYAALSVVGETVAEYFSATSTTATSVFPNASFTNASTTLLSVFDTAYFGGTATTTFDSAGNLAIASGGTITLGGDIDGDGGAYDILLKEANATSGGELVFDSGASGTQKIYGKYLHSTFNTLDVLTFESGYQFLFDITSAPFSNGLFTIRLSSDASAGNRFEVQNNSSTRIFSVDSNGDVLISAPSTANTTALCWDNSGTSFITDCNGSATDLAENFGTNDETITAGDIVAFDNERVAEHFVQIDDHGGENPTTKAFVVKTKEAGDTSAIGVVSTNPNIVFGSDGVFSATENPVPVSLSGRVPVNVSTENGSIIPGDYITPSSIPGVGMKARPGDIVIGRALSNFGADGEDFGQVIVLVGLGWNKVDEGLVEIATESKTPEISESGRVVTTSTNEFQELIDPEGNWSISRDGVFRGSRLVVEEVRADRIKTKELSILQYAEAEETTIGTGRILRGEKDTIVYSNKVRSNSKIFVTFTSDLGGRSWFISQKIGESNFNTPNGGTATGMFRVELSSPLADDVTFDWWIIDTDGTSEATAEDGQVASPPPTAPTSTDVPIEEDPTVVENETSDATDQEVVDEGGGAEQTVEMPPVEQNAEETTTSEDIQNQQTAEEAAEEGVTVNESIEDTPAEEPSDIVEEERLVEEIISEEAINEEADIATTAPEQVIEITTDTEENTNETSVETGEEAIENTVNEEENTS